MGLLGILAIVLLSILLRGNDGTADATPTLAPDASGPTASSAASEGAHATGSPGTRDMPGSGAAGVALERDAIVATTVEALAVRAGPSTSEDRFGSLANRTPAFVVDGPVDGDGYRWYLLSGLGLPPNTGCSTPFETDPFNCPVWFGWVASADTDGTPWLEPRPQECATAPFDFEDIVIGVTDLMRLHCFGSDPMTFRAWWPQLPDDAEAGGVCVVQDTPSGWLLCHHTNDNAVAIDSADPHGGIGLRVTIDPASGVAMPERGTWIELTAHLDDPAAQSCDDDAFGTMLEEQPPETLVLFCRFQLVVDAVTAVDGP